MSTLSIYYDRPVPQTLKEREDRDTIAGEEKATKLSDELRASQLSAGTREAGGTAATVNRRRVKGGRLLAKATGERYQPIVLLVPARALNGHVSYCSVST